MIKADAYFKSNLLKIKNEGSLDRNPRPKYEDGVQAHSKFITMVFEEYDLSKGEFPFTTLRNTAVKIGIREILWIYQKQSNSLAEAREMGINWWDEWNVGDDTIGHRYGYTIRQYSLMDKLLDGLKNDPFSRRHIIDMYQYSNLEETKGLHPCAFMTQWAVRDVDGDLYLDLLLTQRSSDYLMANYINKMQYVALQMMVAGHLGYKIGKFGHIVNNLHVYDRHIVAMDEILDKEPTFKQPKLILKENKNFYDYTIDDFVILDIDGITKLESKLEIAI
jgi:thymidylate synthase